MSRSAKKGPFTDDYLIKKVETLNTRKSENRDPHLVAPLHDRPRLYRTHARSAQRQKFIPVYVTENMVGHKLGEFSPTRTFKGHAPKATEKAAR